MHTRIAWTTRSSRWCLFPNIPSDTARGGASWILTEIRGNAPNDLWFFGGSLSSEIAAHYNGICFTIPDVGVDTTFSGVWISPGGQVWIGRGPNVMRYAP